MIRAYDEVFLDDAMDNLGTAIEYATLFCGIGGQEFMDLFVNCGIAAEFERGNVKYISGMSGIELAVCVLNKCGLKVYEIKEIPYCDYPREYWIGWIIAYYQWYINKPFEKIFKCLSYELLDKSYGVLHEAHPLKFVSVFDSIMEKNSETNLAHLRKLLGFSQSELAKKSGVSLRSIQMYEQRRNNINNAQYNVLKAITDVLGCKVEEVLE